MKTPISYAEVVKTIVFDVIETENDGLIYRLEILKTNKGFKGQLFRLDTYSLPCSFYQHTADESLYVLDNHSHFIDLDEKWFDDPQSCVDYVAHSLTEKFKKAFPMQG